MYELFGTVNMAQMFHIKINNSHVRQSVTSQVKSRVISSQVFVNSTYKSPKRWPVRNHDVAWNEEFLTPLLYRIDIVDAADQDKCFGVGKQLTVHRSEDDVKWKRWQALWIPVMFAGPSSVKANTMVVGVASPGATHFFLVRWCFPGWPINLMPFGTDTLMWTCWGKIMNKTLGSTVNNLSRSPTLVRSITARENVFFLFKDLFEFFIRTDSCFSSSPED